jgi:hypothetical protein
MSTEFNEMFVTLVCPQCGGKVEIEPAVFDADFIEREGVYLYLGATRGENIRCLHCGTGFVRRQSVSLYFEGEGTLQIDTGGGAFIGGQSIPVAAILSGEMSSLAMSLLAARMWRLVSISRRGRRLSVSWLRLRDTDGGGHRVLYPMPQTVRLCSAWVGQPSGDGYFYPCCGR